MLVTADSDQAKLIVEATPTGAHVQCAPAYFPGPWDAVVVPASLYFASPALRRGPDSGRVYVYGPAHLFRSAWLAGARDYLREPWSPEELFLRLRGSTGALDWHQGEEAFRLEGRIMQTRTQSVRLSTTEAALLHVLVLRRGTTVSRAILAWSAECSEGRVVDTLMGRLRQKLARLGVAGESIASVRGVGYRLP